MSLLFQEHKNLSGSKHLSHASRPSTFVNDNLIEKVKETEFEFVEFASEIAEDLKSLLDRLNTFWLMFCV